MTSDSRAAATSGATQAPTAAPKAADTGSPVVGLFARMSGSDGTPPRHPTRPSSDVKPTTGASTGRRDSILSAEVAEHDARAAKSSSKKPAWPELEAAAAVPEAVTVGRTDRRASARHAAEAGEVAQDGTRVESLEPSPTRRILSYPESFPASKPSPTAAAPAPADDGDDDSSLAPPANSNFRGRPGKSIHTKSSAHLARAL